MKILNYHYIRFALVVLGVSMIAGCCVSCSNKTSKDIELSEDFIDKIYSNDYSIRENFSNGMLCVCKDDKYGFINSRGEEIIPCIYDDARWFREGLASVKKNCKYGFINIKGEEVIPCIYDVAGEFQEGLASVRKNDKYGFINIKGEEVIPCIYDGAGGFQQGLASVEKNGKHGFINIKGEEVIPCIYDYADGFQEGLSRVFKNDINGFVDKFGNDTFHGQAFTLAQIKKQREELEEERERLEDERMEEERRREGTPVNITISYTIDRLNSDNNNMVPGSLYCSLGKCQYIESAGIINTPYITVPSGMKLVFQRTNVPPGDAEILILNSSANRVNQNIDISSSTHEIYQFFEGKKIAIRININRLKYIEGHYEWTFSFLEKDEAY